MTWFGKCMCVPGLISSGLASELFSDFKLKVYVFLRALLFSNVLFCSCIRNSVYIYFLLLL